MTDDAALLSQAAREAGTAALRIRARGLDVWTKSGGSPVTNADIEVDDLLKEALLGARPHYGWLSEETADDPVRLDQETLFVVDPIDGTRAYVKGQPWFTVCIAVVRGGRPVAAAVYAPELDDLFEAELDRGARLNGETIRASGADTLDGARMLGDPRMFSDPRWPRPWPPMTVTSRNSIAYRMALVAGGGHHAAVALSPKNDWDVAAADLIVQEAGGLATDHLGRGFTYNQPVPVQTSLVCAAPAVHPLILDRLSHIDLSRPSF